MEMILQFFQSAFSAVGPFFILLGLLIFVHELGHFAVAKLCGVRVETFSLGFGKKIFQFKKGDTTYCLSLIPLGGYVKMFGDDPTAEVAAPEKKYSFLHKPVGQRIAIVLAGPLMNLFFAGLIFITIAFVGEEVPGPQIGDVPANSVAYAAGFRSGDVVQAINGGEVKTWKQIQTKVQDSANKELTFAVARAGQEIEVKATPVLGENENVLSTTDRVGTIEGFSLESLASLIGIRDLQSPAARAGLRPLDLILSIDGKETFYAREIDPQLKAAINAGKESVELKVKAYKFEEKSAERIVQLPLLAAAKSESPMQALGMESAELYLARISPQSPAGRAPLMVGDRILSVNGETLTVWSELLERVRKYQPTENGLNFKVLRHVDDRSQELEFNIAPEQTKIMNAKGQEEKFYAIGVLSGFIPTPNPPVLYRISSPVEGVVAGLKATVDWTGMMAMGFVRLIQGEVSLKNIGGVISIGRFASHSFEAGLSSFLRMMAIISLNLFLINLLPIPVLDGGHLVFFTIEALRGAPISLRKMEVAQQVGLVLLFTLMIFSFYNDINNLFFSGW